MAVKHSTAEVPSFARARAWEQIIGLTYFPLEITIPRPETFQGEISAASLGALSISSHQSGGLCYRRRRRHLSHERDEQYLVTVPRQCEVYFSQGGHEVRCPPGGFILQRSHEPYEFSHSLDNALTVLKVPSEVLRHRVRAPDRFCALNFDATTGAGALFVDMLRLLPQRLPELTDEGRSAVGKHVLDLLVLALESDDRVLRSQETSIRTAHLQRVESFVRRNLHDPDLSPQTIAHACGMSTRYLHQVFQSTGHTVAQWVREQRLLACHEALKDPYNTDTIAEIAYRWGFCDQAQFSRAYRRHFGGSPRETRMAVREKPTLSR